MTQISFKISARTAKLIGRENFSNPEGALIELVKNGYDADAKDCIVIFSIKNERIPSDLSIREYANFSKENSIVKSSYKKKGNNYVIIQSLNEERITLLQQYFFKNNSIYIIDNGHGMSKKIIDENWMEIGTGNKEEDYISIDGRIKTGAKGIGRFALDRLGYVSQMWTTPKEKKEPSSYWDMDWRQFDKKNISLHEITANIEENKLGLKEILKQEFQSSPKLFSKIEKTSLLSGTIIKISNLKDNWNSTNLKLVFKSLEALVPPKEMAIPFRVLMYSGEYLKEYGEIDTAFFNDYDYKIESEFNPKTFKVELTLTRNELDLKIVKNKYSELFKKEKFPYDLKSIVNKKIQTSISVFEILKWERNAQNASLLKALGQFDFSFYFIKNTITQKERFPYRNYNIKERQNVLQKFGGVKIYRDSFRVRPYGDAGNDWLKLGERNAQSPAGAGQRIGDWRVGPNQIAGIVKISRIINAGLIDKSDRGALIENESFILLRRLITGIINYFELDRSIILHKFYLEIKALEEANRRQEIQSEAVKLADKLFEERVKSEKDTYGYKSDLFSGIKESREKEVYKKVLEEGLKNLDSPEEADAEIAQVRTLASLGLIVSSFAHELKEVKNNVDDIEDLAAIYSKLVTDQNKKLNTYADGLNIIDSLKIDIQKVAHWVEYSMTAIKLDKRKRTSLKFDGFFSSLNKQWSKVLTDRHITLDYKHNITSSYLFKAFEMDMNTIFSNLISNSIDALNNLKIIRERKITIISKLVRNNIEIVYSDTGTGLPKIFQKEKEKIFLPFTTSKKDKDGNDIGTGLGMYLVNNVVEDNNGTIQILDSNIGFKLKIAFPIRKK